MDPEAPPGSSETSVTRSLAAIVLARGAVLANLRAAHRGGESPALRLTRYFCRHELEQPVAAMAISSWSSELGTRRMDFCIDLGLRERRVAVAPTV